MKKQVVYIHGGEAFNNHEVFLRRLQEIDIRDLPISEKSVKWVDTLANKLGEKYEVFTPQMPNKQNAKYEEWKIWFERHFEYLHDGVILIGCSLGSMFLSKYLSGNTVPFSVKALFLMASPVHIDGFNEEDCGDFVFSLDEAKNIQEKIENVYILHSKDDFLVPYEHALKYAEVLPKAKLVTFEDKNHFLVAELPELIEMIQETSDVS